MENQRGYVTGNGTDTGGELSPSGRGPVYPTTPKEDVGEGTESDPASLLRLKYAPFLEHLEADELVACVLDAVKDMNTSHVSNAFNEMIDRALKYGNIAEPKNNNIVPNEKMKGITENTIRYQRLMVEAARMATRNRRGVANILIISSDDKSTISYELLGDLINPISSRFMVYATSKLPKGKYIMLYGGLNTMTRLSI